MKKIMIKRVLTSMLILTLLLSLCGCTSSKLNRTQGTDNTENNNYAKVECMHKNIGEMVDNDLTKYEDTDEDDQHKVIEEVTVYCKDCKEKLEAKERISYKNHTYEGDFCKFCDHKKETTSNSDLSNQNSSGTSESLKDIPFKFENSNSGYAVFSKSGINTIMYIYVGAKENPDLNVGDETTAILEYDVSKFSSFTCTLISKNVLDNNEARLRIYGDGELIYESLKMQSGNSVNIDMDISKYNTLKFEAVAKVDEKYNKKGLFTLKAAKLWY